MSGRDLFRDTDWHSFKDKRIDAMNTMVNAIERDRIANTPMEDICKSLRYHKIDVPHTS